MRSLQCYFGVYFPRCFATREINTKITLSSAHKQFATRVYTLFFIYLGYIQACRHLYNGRHRPHPLSHILAGTWSAHTPSYSSVSSQRNHHGVVASCWPVKWKQYNKIQRGTPLEHILLALMLQLRWTWTNDDIHGFLWGAIIHPGQIHHPANHHWS